MRFAITGRGAWVIVRLRERVKERERERSVNKRMGVVNVNSLSEFEGLLERARNKVGGLGQGLSEVELGCEKSFFWNATMDVGGAEISRLLISHHVGVVRERLVLRCVLFTGCCDRFLRDVVRAMPGGCSAD